MIEKLRYIVDSVSLNNYIGYIKSNHKDLYLWVKEQLPEISNLNEKIYRLLHPINSCKYGNSKKFLNYSKGYGYCGRINECKCLYDVSSTTHKWQDNFEKKELAKVKRSDTKLKKFGSPTYNNREKSTQTLLDNYGVSNPMESITIVNRLKENNIRKYGVDNPSKLQEIKERQKQTNFEKYGGWFTTTDKHKLVLKENSINANSERVIMYDKNTLTDIAKDLTPVEISNLLGYTNSSNVIQRLKTFGVNDYKRGKINSVWQNEIYEFIRSHYEGYIEIGNRKILNGLEIDIYLPEINVAIECNGNYWHSEQNGKNKEYHLRKKEECEKSGIRLIHLWEYQWAQKQHIVKSRLLNIIGAITKIGARKCELLEIRDRSIVNRFLNENHIQGSVDSPISIALLFDNNIVAMMTLGNARYTKNVEFELLRYCNKLGYSVTGGASRLFSYFIKSNNVKSVLSYSDRNWNTGKLYENLGFEYTHSSSPSYYYTCDYVNFENRMKYQKHKLPKLLESFDPNLTEWENMKANGYDRIWDCGNDVWVWNRDK